jgi:hypothetical protein
VSFGIPTRRPARKARQSDPRSREMQRGGGGASVRQDCLSVRSGVLWKSRLVDVVVALVVGAYCWFAADLRPFTAPIDAAVAVPSVIVAVLAWGPLGSRGSTAADRKAVKWRDAAPWAVLFGLLAAFEVAAYFSSPRRDHPTLSSIADSLMSTHLGRAAAFALWLLLGWALLLRRTPS